MQEHGGTILTGRPLGRNLLALSMAVLMIATGLSAFMIMVPELVSGTFRYVGEDSTYETLQDALDAAEEDDIIIIGDGIINGSFNSDKTGLFIIGNTTGVSVLRLEGDSISSISGSGLILERLTIENGTLEVKGDNANITNVEIGKDGGSIHIKNSTGSHIKNITFSDPDHLGLRIFNCTNTYIDGLFSAGVSSELISIESSSNIEIKNLDMTLDEDGTALSIDLSNSVLVDDPQLISTDSNNIGIFIGNSSNIDIKKGNISIVGAGIKIDNSSTVDIYQSNIMTLDPGSFGLWTDLLDNSTIDGCNFIVNNDGVGASFYRFASILTDNSSFFMTDRGIGIYMEYGSDSTILNSTFSEQGKNTSAIKLTDVNNMELFGLDWSSDSSDTVFLTMELVQDIDIDELDLDIQGSGSTGILGLQIVERTDLRDSFFNIEGRGIGIDMENWKDSRMSGNRIDVKGMNGLGSSIFSSNVTSSGNAIYLSGEDGVGTSLTGVEFLTISDRIYTYGRSAVSMVVHDLMKMTALGTLINNTGILIDVIIILKVVIIIQFIIVVFLIWQGIIPVIFQIPFLS